MQWTPEKALLLAWTITGGVALFSGLLILQASFAFWTTESLEVFNVLTYGGIQAAQFPLSLYAAWFRNFLLFVVPLAASVVSLMSTMGNKSPAAGVVVSSVNADIFFVLMNLSPYTLATKISTSQDAVSASAVTLTKSPRA